VVKKERFHIEYIFNRVSKSSLWNSLTTDEGLAEWFAEDVTVEGKIFSFYWEGYPSKAELLGINPFVYVRFRWLEEEPYTYFEFRLHKAELIGGIMLEIVDFAEKEEKQHAISLWNTQIKALKRRLGL
jgi:uncharacterized protein YndB with AHSA1/START domain